MKKLIALIVLVAALLVSLVAVSTASAANWDHVNAYAVVYKEDGNFCTPNTNPECRLFAQWPDGFQTSSAISQMTHWIFNPPAWWWTGSAWECCLGDYYVNAWTTRYNAPPGTVTVWARRACPTGGGYHFSAQRTYNLPQPSTKGAVRNLFFGGMQIIDDQQGCQPRPFP